MPLPRGIGETNHTCKRFSLHVLLPPLQIIVADTGNNRLQIFHVKAMPGIMPDVAVGSEGRRMDAETTENLRRGVWSAYQSNKVQQVYLKNVSYDVYLRRMYFLGPLLTVPWRNPSRVSAEKGAPMESGIHGGVLS